MQQRIQRAIQKSYRLAVETSLELQPYAYPKPDDKLHLPGKPGATALCENGIVKFIIPEIPPRIKARDPLQNRLKYHWMNLIIYAHAEAAIKEQFEKALCLIKIFHTYENSWDVDNRVFSYIVNGIRYTGLIPDDSSEHLSLMITGVTGGAQKTEVLLINMDRVIPEFGKMGIDLEGIV